MNTWKVTYTAVLEDGAEMPNQSVRFPNFWRAASWVMGMKEKGKLVAGETKYTKI